MEAVTLYRPSTARLLVHHPVLWGMAAMLSAGMGVVTGGAGALLVLGGALGVGCVTLRMRSVRGWLERSARRASHQARRDDRADRLRGAGVRRDGLVLATRLVDQTATANPALAVQLELEELLDRYTELELAVARYERLFMEKQARPMPETSRVRAMIHERLVAVHRECEARLAAGRDELASIIELLQLLHHRSVLEVTELPIDPVGDCLALLDE
jgi:hypothetical protein